MKLLTALMIVSLLWLADGAIGQERPKITSISHLAVYTTDSAKAQNFYVHDLGAVKAPDPENPAGVRYYFSAAQFLEVLPLPTGLTSVNRLDHAAFNTSDAGAMRKYLQAHGVEVPSDVTRASDGSQYFEVSDPEGNKIQLIQPPAKPVQVSENPLSRRIIHIGYLVHDPAAEDAFYRTPARLSPVLAWRHEGRRDGLGFPASP
jgi:predicted enzyme related to lactoylglutathione lyase